MSKVEWKKLVSVSDVQFGYPFEYNKKKINENIDYKNDYLRLKIKGIQFYKELVEKKNK